MGNRKISDDLKEAALRLRQDGQTPGYIKHITGISRRTLFRTQKRKHDTGSVAKAQAIGRGRPRSLLHSDAAYLLRLARHKPTLFLDEYARRLKDFRHLPISLATIHRTLERAGLSVKHVQKLASERDPILRADFIRRISRYPTDYLICIDEVSKDDRTYARLWGRARRGRRAEQHNPFVRKRRLSMVAGMALDEGIVAARVVEGSFTKQTFMEYLRDDVVRDALNIHPLYLTNPTIKLPMTTPYPGPRSVLIMDNARIHHSPEIDDLVRGYGKLFPIAN
jgi:transposase